MSFFKRQPEYVDRQSNAAKAKSALLREVSRQTGDRRSFASGDPPCWKSASPARRVRPGRAAAEEAHKAEAERLAKLKAEEEGRARQLAAEQKARRDERYASRKKRKKGLRYARPTGAPTNGSDSDSDED